MPGMMKKSMSYKKGGAMKKKLLPRKRKPLSPTEQAE